MEKIEQINEDKMNKEKHTVAEYFLDQVVIEIRYMKNKQIELIDRFNDLRQKFNDLVATLK